MFLSLTPPSAKAGRELLHPPARIIKDMDLTFEVLKRIMELIEPRPGAPAELKTGNKSLPRCRKQQKTSTISTCSVTDDSRRELRRSAVTSPPHDQ
jgi:hypothetical protein